MIRFFENPWVLVGAAVLPALIIAALVVSARRRRERIARLGGNTLVSRLTAAPLDQPVAWRAIRLGLAGALFAVALAGPRWGSETTAIRGEGVDLVFALDASLSMLATDERPNRLERMKQEVRRLRALSPNDRVALLAFAGRSYILSPLTVDDGALELFLDNLDPSVVGQAGSSISRTIRQGVELLGAASGGSDRALIVMSDGESWEPIENVEAAAREAAEANVSLVTVGFGTTTGTTIPIDDGGSGSLKRDESGEIVITRYTPDMLRAAAEAAGGTFIAANVTDKAAQIRSALSRLRAQVRTVDTNRTMTPRFHLFLFPALLLLMLDTVLGERRRPRRRLAPAARAAAVVALLCVGSIVPVVAHADDAADAARHYRAGRYAQAAALYRRAIENGDRRPAVLYNLGTALLAADSLTSAADVLDRASRATDADLRYRALFNLGLAQLRMGLAAADGTADRALDAALDSYKKVLLVNPEDPDAKWNYELALREQQAGGGGGGGGQDEASDGGGGGADGEDEQPAGGLAEQQAEQLLNSAAREERAVQGRQQRQSRPEQPRVGKDW